MPATPRPPTKAELNAAARAAGKAAKRASEIADAHHRNVIRQERRASKLRAAMELEQQKVATQEAAEQAAIQARRHRAHLRLQANAAALAKYTAQYTEEARQILQCLHMTLTTRTLSKLEQPAIVAPVKATLRALCLGLVHLQTFTKNPLTRVDPAAIEEAFPKFTVCDLLRDKDVPDAVLITILVDTSNHYIFATPRGDDVHFEHRSDGYVDTEIYPNILHIGNGVPGESPKEMDAYYEMLAKCLP